MRAEIPPANIAASRPISHDSVSVEAQKPQKQPISIMPSMAMLTTPGPLADDAAEATEDEGRRKPQRGREQARRDDVLDRGRVGVGEENAREAADGGGEQRQATKPTLAVADREMPSRTASPASTSGASSVSRRIGGATDRTASPAATMPA